MADDSHLDGRSVVSVVERLKWEAAREVTPFFW
jgi:hypothetical protein